MATGHNWVAGGELGSTDKSAEHFKQILLDILEDNESVTKALKRLKPLAKRTTNKRKTRTATKKAEDRADTVEDPDERAEKDKLFNLLTEAAGELMSLGFEDIYQDSKHDIAANLHKDADQGVSRGGVVWHDDGTVQGKASKEHAMYKRSSDNAGLSYEESAQAASNATSQTAAAVHLQIPTPVSAAISEADLAAAAAASAPAEPILTETAEPPLTDDTPSVSPEQTHMGNGIAAQDTVSDHSAQDALPSQKTGQVQAEPAAASPEPPAASDNAQPVSTEAVAAAAHITQAADPVSEVHALPASDPAKGSDTPEPPAKTDDAQQADHRSEHKAIEPSSDTPMPDGSTDTALNSAPVRTAQQQDGDTPTPTASAEPAVAQQGSWTGTSKGPGLGESREFTGGPINFERPKFRHAPYGPPPIRGAGRFEGGRSSPRGRSSPTGRSFGRGFSEPPRSSIMRPQYRQQPPSHMPPGAFAPPQYGGYSPQPPPPPYQHQAPYYPPPQQPYPPQVQPGYPQYQQAYSSAPQQPYPPQYHDQQYPAQPPQYDAQWQQYQAPQQEQYAAYQQPAAYPAASAPPAE